MSPARRSRSEGFTLIEVMAAVAVLGVFGTVLAQQAIQGMHYEGDARRRMHASLLADDALWQVEAGLKLGAPPQPQREERATEDGFRVQTEVQPLDPAQLGLGPPSDRSDRQSADAAAALPVPLFHVSIRVAWQEGLVEQSVTRTTFAYDGRAVAQALGAAQGQEAADQQPADRQQPQPPAEEEPQ